MVLTSNEVLSVIPLSGLAVVYWVRDKYMYNRQDGRWYESSRHQLTVLAVFYPLWIFFGWVLGVQTNRGHVAAAFVSTTAQHVSGHYTVIGILNDSYRMTRQQLISLFIGLVLAYVWTTYWLIVNAA